MDSLYESQKVIGNPLLGPQKDWKGVITGRKE